MTCMKQEFCIHEKYCQRHIGQNFDSCILFSRNSKPMTNEEWFCSLSTEEKAEFLVKIELSAMHPVKRGAVDMEKFIEDVVEWLKQPHNSPK